MLRHSSDDEPGYSRQKKGRSWAYFDEHGKPVTDRAKMKPRRRRKAAA